MLVCPDCRSELQETSPGCTACGWRLKRDNGILCMLSARDASSAHFEEYRSIYDTLAERNARTPSLSERYITIMAEQFLATIGNVAGADICDIGAGRGAFIHCAQQAQPASLTAVDVAMESLVKVYETYGIRAVQANAENIPFVDEFDVISATDIMEHVLNIADFLITANWALKKGGLLAIRVPYRENLKYYSRFFGLPFPYAHLRTFNKKLLTDTIEHYGFKVQRTALNGFEHNRLHDFWQARRILAPQISSVIRSFFASDADVASIAPWIGRLFMKPIEITAVAVKVEHVKTTNAYSAFFDYRKLERSDA